MSEDQKSPTHEQQMKEWKRKQAQKHGQAAVDGAQGQKKPSGQSAAKAIGGIVTFVCAIIFFYFSFLKPRLAEADGDPAVILFLVIMLIVIAVTVTRTVSRMQ